MYDEEPYWAYEGRYCDWVCKWVTRDEKTTQMMYEDYCLWVTMEDREEYARYHDFVDTFKWRNAADMDMTDDFFYEITRDGKLWAETSHILEEFSVDLIPPTEYPSFHHRLPSEIERLIYSFAKPKVVVALDDIMSAMRRGHKSLSRAASDYIGLDEVKEYNQTKITDFFVPL